MNCEILHSLCIRSNGSISCDDDYGQAITLGEINNSPDWDILKVFSNKQYRHLEYSLANQTMPWPEFCKHCALLQAGYFENGIKAKRLRKIQIEPSLRCNLMCPNCSRIAWIRTGIDPLLLDLRLYEKLLISLRNNDFCIDNIEYCGQGEPLTHPEYAEFVKIGRSIYRNTPQRLFTNGNFNYHDKVKDQFLEKIIVACDGYYQSSYEQYRINGHVSQPLKFMEDAKKFSPATQVVWKYVLFEFNDYEEELLKAQDIADKIGIDTLLFILTPTANKSRQYDIDNRNQFPLVSKKAVLEAHPLLTHIKMEGIALSPNDSRALLAEIQLNMRCYCVIDMLYITERPNRLLLCVAGWVMEKNGKSIMQLYISHNGKDYVRASAVNNKRSDVAQHYPQFKNEHTGFEGFISLPKVYDERTCCLMVKIITENNNQDLFSVAYQFR